MIRIAIVDDEERDLQYLNHKIKAHFESKKLQCDFALYTSAAQVIKKNIQNPFDIVFLDIDMPQLTGMDAAEELHVTCPRTLIVFITNHDELVYKAFRFKAIGFIRKNYFDEEIDEMIDILWSELQRNNHMLSYTTSHSIITIDLFEVMFIKSDDHYIEFYFQEKRECIRENFSHIQSQIERYGFIQIHARYAVNYRYIYSIERTIVLLNNGMQLPISRNRVASVKEKFQMFSRSLS